MSAEPGDALRRVVAALRRDGDEVQWTQVVAAVADSDPDFAGRLALTLVNAAPHPTGLARRQGDLAVPARLSCRAEVPLSDSTGQPRGRVDLIFESPEEGFALLVEVKLGAGYRKHQVPDYLKALEPYERRGRAGLMAITRARPLSGEPDDGTSGWLGSVRWSDLLGGLRGLRHHDPQVESVWRVLIDVLEEKGDFGVTEITRDAVSAWALWRRGRKQLVRLLGDIAHDVEEIVAGELRRAGIGEAKLREATKTRPAFDRDRHTRLFLSFDVAERGDRLRVGFLAFPGQGGAREAAPRFRVEARHPGAASLPPAVQTNLREIERRLEGRWPGDEVTNRKNWWGHPRSLDEWFGGSVVDVMDRLLTFVGDDVATLVESGIFSDQDGLLVPSGSAGPAVDGLAADEDAVGEGFDDDEPVEEDS